MKKQRILIFVSLIVILGLLAGCQLADKETKSNSKWQYYSNKYYKIKYPTGWKKAELDGEVGFAEPDPINWFPRLDITLDKEVNSKSAFYNRVSGHLYKLRDDKKVKQIDKFEVNDHLAYKVIAENNNNQQKHVYLFIYNQIKYDLHFVFQNDTNYQRQKELREEMIKSFEFTKFSPLENNSTELTSREAIEDALYMRKKLERIHPDIYSNRSEIKTAKEFNRLLWRLNFKSHWSKIELYRAFAPFVAGIKDGHTALKAPETIENKKVIPLLIRLQDDQLLITDNFSSKSLPLGSKILAVNGVRTSKILWECRKRISCEQKQFADSIINRSFVKLFGLNFDFKKEYHIKYKAPTGTINQVTVKGIKELVYDSKVNKKETADQDYWQLTFPEKKIPLLTVNTFCSSAFPKSKKDEFKKDIKNYFRKIKNKNCQALIIDLRNNPGGLVSHVNYLYEFIANEAYIPVLKAENKYSKYTLFHKYDYPLSLAKKRLEEVGPDRIETKAWIYKLPPYNRYRFDGKVYILVGPRTYSGGVIFAAMAKASKERIIVGEETGGCSSTYFAPVGIKLPNSRLRMVISSKYGIRPDRKEKPQGVIPDIKVKTDWLKRDQGIDQVLDQTLQIIKNN